MPVEALARSYSQAQRREPAVASGHAHEGDRRCSPASKSRYFSDLHQGGPEQTCFGGVALAWECVMIESRSMAVLASDYLAERRLLGFDLGISGTQIIAFARFVDAAGHTGPLTTRIVLDWVQGKARHARPFSWARRLEVLRPFARYLARLDPAPNFRTARSSAGRIGGSRRTSIPARRSTTSSPRPGSCPRAARRGR